MKIVSVIPISKSAPEDTLTYWSADDIPVGSIIEIPLRKQKILGLVTETSDAGILKSSIKELAYTLRKIPTSIPKGKVSDWFWNILKSLSERRLERVGKIIKAVLPENIEEITSEISNKKNARPEEYAMQLEEGERFDSYKSIIRESFAKKETVLFLSPTIESAKRAREKLSRGIENHTYLAQSKKIDKSTHSLIIGTGKNIFDTSHAKTIIIENESSWSYKERRMPYIDWREVAEILAKEKKVRIFYGDTILSIEMHKRILDGKVIPYSRLSKRIIEKIPTLVVDIKPRVGEKKFQILSDELKEMFQYGRDHKKKIFVFGVRRGISPQTVCKDCGKTVECEKCSNPVVLHKRLDESVFICHHCGATRDAHERCKACESWNLISFGIGTAGIEDILKGIGIENIFRLDSDSANTISKANKIVDKWIETENGVLIGTELSLRLIERQSADFAVIFSLDSLFSIPDFRISEKVMHLIAETKSKAKENFLIQTRQVDNKIMEEAVNGNLEEFVDTELHLREKYKYPPFSTFIKVTLEGEKDVIADEALKIKEKFEEYSPIVFPAFIKSDNKKSMLHILIKSLRDIDKEKALRNKIVSLPPYIKINVNPESLL